MNYNFSVKKKLIWIVYILILFSAIKFINKKQVEMKFPVINLNKINEIQEEGTDLEFTILSINTEEIPSSEKKEYIYTIQVSKDLDINNYTEISGMVLSNLKNKNDFQKLSLSIYNKDNIKVFTFNY